MQNNLYSCLWFDGKIKEATQFYCSLFPNTKIHAENNIITKFELEGTIVKLLNGGALFKLNPSISFFVKCETKAEIEKLWASMLDGGKVMMNLGNYPWCEQYGWIEDKYGMTWQFFLGSLAPEEQKIIPCMLFTNEVFGKAGFMPIMITNCVKLLVALQELRNTPPVTLIHSRICITNKTDFHRWIFQRQISLIHQTTIRTF